MYRLCRTATQVKRQKIWLLFWNKSLVLSSVFVVYYLLSAGCHEDQRLCTTNVIRFISKLWCAWGSVTFDPDVDLNGDAVSRSRYEQFHSVRSNLCEIFSLRRRSREPSRVGCLWRNFRVWHFKEYPEVLKNSWLYPSSSKGHKRIPWTYTY